MTSIKHKPQHNESHLQRQCVTWFRLQHRTKLLFAIPNGGKRSKVEASIMQGEGVVAGVADLFLMFGNGKYNGMFIEMKYGTNGQTDKQQGFEMWCIKEKYKYVVCRTLEQFIHEVNDYIKQAE